MSDEYLFTKFMESLKENDVSLDGIMLREGIIGVLARFEEWLENMGHLTKKG